MERVDLLGEDDVRDAAGLVGLIEADVGGAVQDLLDANGELFPQAGLDPEPLVLDVDRDATRARAERVLLAVGELEARNERSREARHEVDHGGSKVSRPLSVSRPVSTPCAMTANVFHRGGDESARRSGSGLGDVTGVQRLQREQARRERHVHLDAVDA